MSPIFSSFSLPPLASGSLYYAFDHSDLMGQGIVILLTLMSIATWTLMLEKGIGLSRAYKGSRRFLEEFRRKRNVMALRNRAANDSSPVARVYESGFARLAQINGDETGGTISRSRPLSELEIEVVRSTMEETVADQIVKLEDKIIVLMTAVSISPFLGLFGTVWGIMLAFTEMAMAGKPDIQTLAPGVSGALLTTVLGLLVAIPSLIGYNAIAFYIKQLTVYMDNQVEEFANKLKLAAAEEEHREKAENTALRSYSSSQVVPERPVQSAYPSPESVQGAIPRRPAQPVYPSQESGQGAMSPRPAQSMYPSPEGGQQGTVPPRPASMQAPQEQPPSFSQQGFPGQAPAPSTAPNPYSTQGRAPYPSSGYSAPIPQRPPTAGYGDEEG